MDTVADMSFGVSCREGGMEGGREGGREGGGRGEGGREGGREKGGREAGREAGRREGGREELAEYHGAPMGEQHKQFLLSMSNQQTVQLSQ